MDGQSDHETLALQVVTGLVGQGGSQQVLGIPPRRTSSTEGKCEDYTRRIYLELADARARQALAERQVVEVNHQVANMLQLIATLIERQRRKQDSPLVRDELNGLAARVHAAAGLHRHLLPPRTLKPVNLAELVQKVAAAFAGVTGLVCETDTEPVIVPARVAMHLATAVNELSWNAYKHAYRGAEGGIVQIVCRREADARIRVSVADRGRGLPTDFDPQASEGFGLMVVSAIARQFGGELQMQSDHGARFTLLATVRGCEGVP